MDRADNTVHIPDFVVRQVGALQLQLAAANEQIAQLTTELEALKAMQADKESASA